VLAKEKEIDVDEGLAGCFVVLEERAGLVQRIANDARQNGRPAEAQLYEPRANEYRRYADIIRRAVLNSLDP
jgi:two-component system chemotaxis response regulator CheB